MASIRTDDGISLHYEEAGRGTPVFEFTVEGVHASKVHVFQGHFFLQNMTPGLRNLTIRAKGFLAKTLTSAGLVFSLLCMGALSFYAFSLSYGLPDGALTTSAGERMPAITLRDDRDQPVDLAQLASGDAVLVFYRGHW